MSFTIDDNTQASTPGQINISKIKYLEYVQLTGLAWLKYASLFKLPDNILFKLYHDDTIVFNYIQMVEQFKYGCLNPSIVINKQKGLLATYTNLTSYGEVQTHVIKISKEPLHLITNIQVENGQKLPSVALYYRNLEDEYAYAWSDFNPKIANCFTNDLNACNQLMSRCSEKAWKCLEIGLRQLKSKEIISLYHVDIDSDLVFNAY